MKLGIPKCGVLAVGKVGYEPVCKAKVVQVARGKNRRTDSLATLASSLTEEVPRLIKVELVAKLSINAMVGVLVIAISELCWMDPIINFLAEDWLLADRKLYRRSFAGLYLLCLHPDKVNELLTKLHEGVCGSQFGGCTLAHQAMTQGFWWPQM